MLDKVKKLVQTLRDRFDRLDKLSYDVANDIKEKGDIFEAQNKKLKQTFHDKLNSYIAEVLDVYRDDVQSVIDGLSDVVNVKKIEPLFVADLLDNGVEGCRLCVVDSIKCLNERIEELDKFSFNDYNPPLQVEGIEDHGFGFEKVSLRRGNGEAVVLDSENYASADPKFKKASVANGYPTNDIAKETVGIALGILIRLDMLENALRNQYSEKEFENFIGAEKDNALASETALLNDYYNDEVKHLLCEEDDLFSEKTFKDISEDGVYAMRGKINTKTGRQDYTDNVYEGEYYNFNLGDLSIKVTPKKMQKKYFELSPILKKYTDGENIKCPFVLDTVNKGNIFLDIDEPGKYPSVALDFIHNAILSFLLSFPARRIKFLLLDVDDAGGFSRYAKLQDLDGLVSGSVVRDERDLDGLIKDSEKNMHFVRDNKIEFNNCSNIFEYNKKAVTNPENINVIVILNYPKGFNTDLSNRLIKLLSQGNKAGFYTILVNNKALAPEFGKEGYNKFIETAKRECNVFKLQGDKIVYDIEMENTFNVNRELSYSRISEYVESLKEIAEKGVQKVIGFNSLFKYIDEQKASKKGIKPAYNNINLPIGMRGSEFMSFELSTLGTSAHALAIGGTGSGKSNLLHTIVLSACYKYSPEELNIYLVDFKGGVEFKFYEGGGDVLKQLPHIRLTGLTSNPEDGVAILNNVLKELRRREDLFRSKTTEDIVQYNEKVKKENRVPRLMVIIDEVQELFERNEMLGQDAIKIMAELFKKGRAFGISLFWASQNVPKTAGIRDKIISQIGTRLCLKLNNPEDASELGIKPERVRSLNRVEKGMALLYDTSGLTKDGIEFRVAYAENSEKRKELVDRINNKWQSVTDAWEDREPLFVVGNDKIPSANEGHTKFTEPVEKQPIISKSNDIYNLNIGQDYISGKAFNIPINLRGSKSNLWMAGASQEELRDIMGFAMLSVIIENATNSDMPKGRENVYYVNGETIASNNPNDLFYVLPKTFEDKVTQIDSSHELVDLFIKLYKIRRQRVDRIKETYPPIFVFINKLQMFTDLFKDNMRQYDVSGTEEAPKPTGGGLFGGFTLGLGGEKGGKLTFTSIFNEVFGRGSDVGIHLVFSVDTPSNIPEIEKEMSACVNKLIIKGVRSDDMMRMISSARSSAAIQTEGLGYWYENSDVYKFKPYRYYSENDGSWFEALGDKYNALR